MKISISRYFISAVASLSLLTGLGLSEAKERPNVLLFFIDDLGWADLGCYGSTFYETPNLDALAAQGVRLTDAYSANPVCSPTRAALMSGKAPQRLGITQWIPQPSSIHFPKEEVSLAEAFQSEGYKTGYIGKWHLGEKDDQLPTAHGFGWMKAVNRAGQPAHYFYPYKRKSKRGNYWDVPDLANGQDGDYLSDAITDHALKFIETNQKDSFFLCLAHYAVHTPIQSPPELVKKYEKKKSQHYSEIEKAPLPGNYNTVSRSRQDHPGYAAMLENLDTNVGRMLSKLKELDLDEKTIVVFTSDNGGHCNLTKRPGMTCNLPLRSGKGWTYEGGIRVPALIRWNGTLKPAVSSVPAITMDLYPTLLDLAGLPLKPEQHLDGQSLKSALEGSPNENLQNRFLAWTYPHRHGSGHRPSRAIRQKGWKLIHFEEDQSTELYNLEKDFKEMRNVASKHPDRVSQLKSRLDAWVEKTTPAKP